MDRSGTRVIIAAGFVTSQVEDVPVPVRERGQAQLAGSPGGNRLHVLDDHRVSGQHRRGQVARGLFVGLGEPTKVPGTGRVVEVDTRLGCQVEPVELQAEHHGTRAADAQAAHATVVRKVGPHAPGQHIGIDEPLHAIPELTGMRLLVPGGKVGRVQGLQPYLGQGSHPAISLPPTEGTTTVRDLGERPDRNDECG